MTPRDQSVFRKAAIQFKAWILVRKTNPYYVEYKGKANYRPKPIGVKPKTATVPINRAEKDRSDPKSQEVVGLVADPYRWEQAFSPDKLARAQDLWDEFMAARFGKDGFSGSFAVNRVAGSKHEGCLTLEGKYLYGDHDLFDVRFSDQSRNLISEVLVGPRILVEMKKRGGKEFDGIISTDNRFYGWEEFSTFLNKEFGYDLIQHGSQFDFEPDFERVDAFAPSGELLEWDGAEVARQYALRQWMQNNSQPKPTADELEPEACGNICKGSRRMPGPLGFHHSRIPFASKLKP